jgi:adenylyltransferase/sulfurtransferase
VGTIGIVDDDVVDSSNLQRQVIHGQSDIGRPKAESARDSIRETNPLVRVVLHAVRLDAANAREIFAGYDVILDGTDNFATRYLVNDAAALAGKPYVWGSILRFDGQVSVFWAAHGPNYRDLYPEAPPAGSVPSCAEGGVLGVLCAQIGSVMAGEAIKLITGIGRTLLGRVLMLNALEMTWREVRVRRDPEAAPITKLVDYEAFCGIRPAVALDPERIVSASELAAMLESRGAGRRDFDLIDVREPGEHAIVSIPGAELVPRGAILSGDVELPRDRELVLHCKGGVRSAEVLGALLERGYTRVAHLDGGIMSWVREVEPEKTVY